MQLLEPASPDSLAAWGLFHAAFEQKEYMEDYVAEEQRSALAALLEASSDMTRRAELQVAGSDGREVPFHVSATDIDLDGDVEQLAVALGNPVQYVARALLLVGRLADADADPQEGVGAEVGLDRLEAVVPSRRSGGPRSKPPWPFARAC
mgnify:CR=1 FL=1